MRGEDRFRHLGAGPRGLGESLDQWGEVGAGVGKQILDPAFGQQGQISLGYAVDRSFLARHAGSPAENPAIHHSALLREA